MGRAARCCFAMPSVIPQRNRRSWHAWKTSRTSVIGKQWYCALKSFIDSLASECGRTYSRVFEARQRSRSGPDYPTCAVASMLACRCSPDQRVSIFAYPVCCQARIHELAHRVIGGKVHRPHWRREVWLPRRGILHLLGNRDCCRLWHRYRYGNRYDLVHGCGSLRLRIVIGVRSGDSDRYSA